MLQFDYSQLPIMHGEREVKGMISWRSIACRHTLGGESSKVQHCREDAQVVDANGTLFDAIPTIVKHGYVLVRGADRRITGIVTASDLSLQFQQLAEPFLLLREIELHIRQLLQDKVTAEDFEAPAPVDIAVPVPKSISDLSFGGYVRLLQKPQVWSPLTIPRRRPRKRRAAAWKCCEAGPPRRTALAAVLSAEVSGRTRAVLLPARAGRGAQRTGKAVNLWRRRAAR